MPSPDFRRSWTIKYSELFKEVCAGRISEAQMLQYLQSRLDEAQRRRPECILAKALESHHGGQNLCEDQQAHQDANLNEKQDVKQDVKPSLHHHRSWQINGTRVRVLPPCDASYA